MGGAGARPCPRPRTPAGPRAARCPGGNRGVRGGARQGLCVAGAPCVPPFPAHPVVGVRAAGVCLLAAVPRGQLPALIDADDPAAARGPALGGLAHLREQGRRRHPPHGCSGRPPVPAPRGEQPTRWSPGSGARPRQGGFSARGSPGRGGPHGRRHGPPLWGQEVAGGSGPPGWPARASGEMGGTPPRAPLSQENAAGTERTGAEVAGGQCRGRSAPEDL